jgi:hypothetical protein
MSLLTKAAGKFDVAFSTLSPEARQRVGLAVYRAYPTIVQYMADLEPLRSVPGLKAATWDLVIALAFRVAKRQSRAFEFSDKELAELTASAPAVAGFCRVVAGAIDGKPMLDAAPTERKKLR